MTEIFLRLSSVRHGRSVAPWDGDLDRSTLAGLHESALTAAVR